MRDWVSAKDSEAVCALSNPIAIVWYSEKPGHWKASLIRQQREMSLTGKVLQRDFSTSDEQDEQQVMQFPPFA
jgi:hypothetical protein